MLSKWKSTFFAALLLAGSAQGQEVQWQSCGPFETSGCIRHILLDPRTEGRLLAAAENGGLWLRDNLDPASGRWTPLTDSLENLQMRGVAVSASNPPSDYLVTTNALGFVYESNDLGRTWSKFTDQSFSYVRRLFMDDRMVIPRPTKGQVVVASRVIVVHVAGRTGYHRIRKVNGDVIGTDRLYPRLPEHNPDVMDAVRHPTLPLVHFIGVRDQGIYRSVDDGRTWTLVSEWAASGGRTAGSKTTMIRLAITPDGQRVVAKVGLRVIISDRGGEAGSWTTTLTSPPWKDDDDGGSDIGYRGNYSGFRGEWTNAIAIHPTDWRIIAVGQADLFVTKDGGSTWSTVPSGHEDVQSMTFTASGDRLLVANDGGVFSLSTASLADRKDLNKGLVTIQFYRNAINGNVVIGNADHQGIRGTQDVNAENPVWTYATSSNSGYGNNALENDFVFANRDAPGRFFVAFQTEDFLRLRFPFSSPATTEDLLSMSDPATPLRPFVMRTDNNAVFNQLNYPVGTVALGRRASVGTMLCSVHEELNETFGIAITQERNAEPRGGPRRKVTNPDGTSSIVYDSPITDFAVWRPRLSGSAVPVVSLLFSEHTADRAFALFEDGRLLANANPTSAATVWRPVGNFAVAAGDFARQIIEDPSNATRLYAMTHQRVQRSTDGGATWTAVGGRSLPAEQFNCLAANESTLYLATATDVLRSTDQGATWRSIGMSLPNAPVMQLQVSSGFLYATTFGRGLWRLALR